MNFNPKKENELNIINLIPEGIYNFEVIDAKDKISNSGNQMIELKLKVWDENGKEHIVYDYLLEAMAFKLKHFADTTGLHNKYEAGEINPIDCISKIGKVHIIIKEGTMKIGGGYYASKNSVKDYVMTDKGAFKVELGKNLKVNSSNCKDDFIDSDLPF